MTRERFLHIVLYMKMDDKIAAMLYYMEPVTFVISSKTILYFVNALSNAVVGELLPTGPP